MAINSRASRNQKRRRGPSKIAINSRASTHKKRRRRPSKMAISSRASRSKKRRRRPCRHTTIHFAWVANYSPQRFPDRALTEVVSTLDRANPPLILTTHLEIADLPTQLAISNTSWIRFQNSVEKIKRGQFRFARWMDGGPKWSLVDCHWRRKSCSLNQ